MSSSQLQFHADPDELLDVLLPDWLAGLDYWYASFADEDRRTSRGPLRLREALPRPTEVVVRLQPFEAGALPRLEFMRRNAGSLHVIAQRRTPEGLRESSIGVVVDDPGTLRTWLRVLRRARRSMHRGATAIGLTGVRYPAPSHRYTSGALALARSGVPMLAIAGGVRYDLSVPASTDPSR